MNETLMLQHMQAVLAHLQTLMSDEDTLARVYENDLQVLADAVPDRGNITPLTWRSSLNGENPFRQTVNRIVTPVVAGGAQWTGDETWAPQAQDMLKRLAALLPQVALQIALYGKAAVLPYFRNAEDELPSLIVPGGYLHLIYNPLRPDVIDRVLSFTRNAEASRVSYTVWEYAPGSIRLYENVLKPANYATYPNKPYPQPQAEDRLPLAVVVYEKNRQNIPYGPSFAALGAMRRFMARLVQENIMYHSSAGAQKVLIGDTSVTGQPITVGPYKLLRLPLGADYKVVGPDVSALNQHTTARQEAAEAVMAAGEVPQGIVGAGDSGEARTIAAQMHEQTSNRVADLAAACLTDAATLLSRMGVIPDPITFSVKTNFPAKRTAEQQNIIAMFTAGLISRLEALLRLQDVGMKVSDDELARAKADPNQMAPSATPKPPTG